MSKKNAVPPCNGGWPVWYDSKNINEILFCEEFLESHPMKCVRGRLFTVDGVVEDEAEVSQQILEAVRCCVTSGLSKLVANGGEGKSRIGLVMRSILGDSMNTTSIQKVENNRFSRADLENKLLMVDDDMDMSALPKTNYIKSIYEAYKLWCEDIGS